MDVNNPSRLMLLEKHLTSKLNSKKYINNGYNTYDYLDKNTKRTGDKLRMAKLHTEFTANQTESNKISDTDQAIRAYIENNDTCIYDNIISEDDRFQVFYNLSELRTGIISWYDFKPSSDVLEIGAGFGALTGTLCKKCSHVTATERSFFRAESIQKRYHNIENLDIYAGNLEDIKFNKKFDYIVLIGILERQGGGSSDRQVYADYLHKLSDMLKPDGAILVVVENRFGLRYFCGATEPHTNLAFDGLNHYPNGTSGYSFSRQELTEILSLAGLPNRKFYYPLPDYKLPQLIYTEDYLPEKNLKERLIPYYHRNDTLVASESELYDEIIANQVFPFFANSFFVECSLKGTFCDVIYAAVSTDRGEERSFATTIHKDGKVRKQPLYQAGVKSAQQLYEHINDLKAHRVPVVEHVWKGEALELPYINQPTLSNYLKIIMGKDLDEFLAILDQIYGYILDSSEEVPATENELLRYIENEKYAIAEKLDWGPIIKKAYMELIPLNCFYEAGQFLFFDQEFVRSNYPAKYVLFRAIHYIYCFTPNAEKFLPQQVLRKKYGMEETWDFYLQEELRFLKEVRNQERYKQFYKWAHVDIKRVFGNAKRLESEAETVANYNISDKMKKIWKVELQMLDSVNAICKKHGIHYFLVHGTLLGAVRHKGFIPWDDDLDIGMLREDYDKFIEVAPKELPEPLSLLTSASESDCFFGGIARIRNSQTTGIETKELGHQCNLGIWMDILPLDVCTKDENKFKRKQSKIRHFQRLLYAQIYGKDFEQYADMKPWLWNWYRLLAGVQSHKALCSKLDKTMKLYTNEASDYVAFFSGYYKHRQLNRKDFETTIILDFEHRKLPAPVGYENYLFMTQGRDYLSFPPEEDRKPKHRGIFDPEHPYSYYQEKLFDIFKNVKSKQIILFGAGMMFEDYMNKYGGKYRPSFLVDNDESKWGRARMGIEIKEPKAIIDVPQNKRKVIICSYYYKEIEDQLKKMGILDYQIYVQEVEWILQAEGKEKVN